MKRRLVFLLIGLVQLGSTLGMAAVLEDKLRQAQSDPASWLMYGRNYAGWRYSELDRINTSNVGRLTPEWIFQTGRGGSQTTPLIHENLMFITGPSNLAWALDLLTGRQIWRYSKKPPSGLSLCCGQPNRGFAILGEWLFKVNIEATLVALDLRTGGVLWETEVADFKKGYSATLAPLVVKDLVLIGSAGADFGARGFIDAYDAATGRRKWRFWIVPEPGEPGSDTWAGDSWRTGGGSVWVTGTYDPELNLVYWGTGNPAPDLDGSVRPGDNLYTCSLVALNPDTGKLVWHFQFTPHDLHDWDAVADPVLIDLVMNGKKVRAVVQANRIGFFYVLDRTNGKFLQAKPYTKVTWAERIDPGGRPVLVPGQDPSEEGTKICPGLGGGHNWTPTAYSLQTGLYYFNSKDGCQTYYKAAQQFVEGQYYMGSLTMGVRNEPQMGSIIAVDPSTAEIKWRTEMISQPGSGMLATAGGLVFSGNTAGYVMALDARAGKVLWRFQAGENVSGAPVTYLFNGRQYVAVAAGQSIITFALPKE
ncbi:MAG: PQQ-dependent dehydrogenase, methanol/ethanol family [Acidobacteria bacterium]|nr:PQQ-dependent dehydrogenase, methanol/ethanol family [Acidobacteriota bacterium]MCI0718809.1 PQQ-dependent dehydrogenase, methanol/ethanol family [Acidobacteriota bacterium]